MLLSFSAILDGYPDMGRGVCASVAKIENRANATGRQTDSLASEELRQIQGDEAACRHSIEHRQF